MPIPAALLALMTDTVTIETVIARPGTPTLDGYPRLTTGGASMYGPPKTYRCHIEFDAHAVTSSDGRTLFSTGRVYLDGAYPLLTVDDRLTLPDEVQASVVNPGIILVETFNDENGLYNTVVHFE